MDTMSFNDDRSKVFEDAVVAMARSRRTFGRSLEPSIIAELYAARELDLTLRLGPNEPGYDATDPVGHRYEIKYRSPKSLVDVNSFNFD